MGRRARLAVLGSIFFASPAFAANETEITPYLHGSGSIGYHGEVIQGQYYRNGAQVGSQKQQRERIDLEGRFGAWDGLEVYFRTAYDSWDRVQWNSIAFSSGTPQDGVEKRKGLTDFTFGARYAILSEARHTGDVTTWTVETNIKLPGSYAAYPDPTGNSAEASAGTPGVEWRLKTA